ncbi:MAG: SDR family NAD(P)-dependent oxidoreductase [Sphingomonadales bacterium]|nr:SDR family NAD(P)-dependent oxidoreductase [Sphingomonadales bacterium]MDE2168288.1 SDR family NAD(P)-dependent oxidoreductase [Sphingomonadales bacterium]
MHITSSTAAIVTGGASGLGLATARALAALGAKVTIFDRNEQAGEDAAREIGGLFACVDVTSDDSVAEGFAKARAAHGQERILVNCAGIVAGARTVGRDKATGAPRAHRLADFQRVIDINLVGTFRCIVGSAAGMVTLDPIDADGQRGVIVNTASIAAQDGQIGQAAYAASKAGVAGLTLPVARDLMSEGIRVNTILPGICETPMMKDLPEATVAALAANVPFPKRLGRAEDYAQAALFLIQHDYMNGECIRMDGAIRMGPR